jgi:hypothetical protein
MAENHQINGGGQGLQYQHHGTYDHRSYSFHFHIFKIRMKYTLFHSNHIFFLFELRHVIGSL